MDVPLFEKCVRFISRNYSVTQLEELVLSKNDLKSNRKFATIVFDDGYKDNIEYAAPILDKYKVKASFYIVTDCIEKNIPTWTYILDYSFSSTKQKKIDLNFSFLPPDLRIEELSDGAARMKYVRELKPVMKKLSHDDRMKIMETVSLSYNDIELPKLMMDWNDLDQLKNVGHYIGSHTVTHCMLGTMSNEEEITNELTQSAAEIKKHLGHFPVTISYPVGSYNDTTIRLSKEAGYKIGLAVKGKKFDASKDDLFEIPRIELYNESWFKSQLRIKDVIGKINGLIKR